MELASLAATEEDSEKLFALVTEINELLEAKQKRLNNLKAASGPPTIEKL